MLIFVLLYMHVHVHHVYTWLSIMWQLLPTAFEQAVDSLDSRKPPTEHKQHTLWWRYTVIVHINWYQEYIHTDMQIHVHVRT